jgi:DNA replication and repair protein RecF
LLFVDLRLEHFRCFDRLELDFSAGINLLHGDNASGKSSLLESLYWLTHKRSFRSRRHSQLIQHGQPSAFAIARVQSANEHACPLAAKLTRDGAVFRYQQAEPQRAFLQRRFPCVLIEPQRSMDFLRESEQRRRWLDRIVFHVEHPFLGAWQQYQRALSQRNAAIRQQGQNPALWNDALVQTAHVVQQYRARQWDTVLPRVQELLRTLAQDRLPAITLQFRPGWDVNLGLLEQLRSSADSERKMGYTLVGPHRADIIVRDDRGMARDWLSRGQTKLLALCFQLALISSLSAADVEPVLLWDDWSSELSTASMQSALAVVAQHTRQAILTSPEADWPAGSQPPASMFHVKHRD